MVALDITETSQALALVGGYILIVGLVSYFVKERLFMCAYEQLSTALYLPHDVSGSRGVEPLLRRRCLRCLKQPTPVLWTAHSSLTGTLPQPLEQCE